jgi:HD-GYP domain-containing protein (c-di-GMP phosphodiesterase class II)
VTTTAAPTAVGEELVRHTRERAAHGDPQRRTRLRLASLGLVATAAIAGAALLVPGGPAAAAWRIGFFVALYAVVSRVEFEIGIGSAIPTQLVLVPMLFAMHVGLVPAAVAAAVVLRTLPDRPSPLLPPSRALAHIAFATHALGPALVIAYAGGLPLRWSAWPVYVLALAAQFAADFLNAALNGAATGVSVRAIAKDAPSVYMVDAALAPVALLLAFATRTHPVLLVLVLPLVLLLRSFSHERKRRIDNALELSDAYRGTAFLLGDVVEADDAYTGSHSRHVVDLVLAVADDLRLAADDRRDAEFTALLHDVGKIRIPPEIINKPAALTPEERAVIETHTIEGEKMLDRVGGLIGHVGRLVRSCHEMWDGRGYPDGLAGEQIPLVARIVCACDAYSAMTTDRPYRKARTKAEALVELQRCAGSQFDPTVVSAIVRIES